VNALYKLADILKANGYVAASEGFEGRTAIGVHSLPGGAPVGLMSSLSA
jgi:hypothetical protein